MNNKTNALQVVLDAFPQLRDEDHVRQFASPVPLVPDTTFDIFVVDSNNIFALVTTDYINPVPQSQELKEVSGQRFEFKDILKPHDSNNVGIKLSDFESMENNFFIEGHGVYYYVARIKSDES